MTAGLGPFTAQGHESQDFGPGVTAEPDGIWCVRQGGLWLKARKAKFAGAIQRDNFHMGVDRACPIGTRALAPEAGIVRTNFFDDKRALCQVIQIHPTTIVFHGHLSKFISQPGDHVTRGQTTARTGCTGACDGPHDHTMVFHTDEPNPNWHEWYWRWFAFNVDRLMPGGDMAGVPWIT